MKIIITSVGTRGDMEPFLAIGQILWEKGHHVICAFPEQFREIVEEAGLEFFSLGARFIEMLESDIGKAAMGGEGSGLKKFVALIKLARAGAKINKELIHKQYEIIEREDPDRIVYNPKAVYPILWGLKHRGKTVMISPVPYLHYTREQAHVAFNRNFGPFLNKLTYSLANFGLITTNLMSAKWLAIKPKVSRRQVRLALASNKAVYTISPSLFSRPEYWGKNLQVLGFHERKSVVDWVPNDGLTDFLAKHPRILFITFGSMTNPNPREKTKVILDILERNRIPAIINTASGGLVEPENYDRELVHFVSGIPYHWLFPKVYAVIHHGGSGTTHLALRYGCATMIIPHIIDQFVWSKIIQRLGVGPKGVRVDKISGKSVEPKILALMHDPSFKREAEKVAGQMEGEDFREEIYRSIIKA